MEQVVDGIRQVTFELPLGIDHVHCYFLRGDVGLILVDTGSASRIPKRCGRRSSSRRSCRLDRRESGRAGSGHGVLVAGDAILGDITPTVGLYPASRPDPLGDYLQSLSRIAELSPSVALGGHGSVIAEPAARAREIAAHHDERLALAARRRSESEGHCQRVGFPLGLRSRDRR